MTVRTRVEQANFIYRDTTDPGSSHGSNAGYVIGARWVNTSTKKEFVCVDNTANNAVWTETTQTGGSGTVIGPNSSDDRHVVVFSGTGGVHVRNSTMVIEDSGNATINGDLHLTGDLIVDGLASVSGTGDVVGPSSVTANTLVRFDGTSGKQIKSTGITVDNNDALTLDMVTGITSLQYNSTGLLITDDGSSAGVGGAVPYTILNTVPTGFVKVGIFPGTNGVTATLVAEPPDEGGQTNIKLNVSDNIFTNGLRANDVYVSVFSETPAGLNHFYATASGTEHIVGNGLLHVGHDSVGGHGLKMSDDASTINGAWPQVPIIVLGIDDTAPAVMLAGRIGTTSQSILQVMPAGFGDNTPSVILTADDVGLGDTYANSVTAGPDSANISASISGSVSTFNAVTATRSGISLDAFGTSTIDLATELGAIDITTTSGSIGITVSSANTISLTTTSGSISLVDTLYPASGLIVSSDISNVAPVAQGTPGMLLTIPSTGAQIFGNMSNDVSSYMIVMTTSAFGTDGIMISVDDQSGSNTFSTGITVLPNAISSKATDVTNNTETDIASSPSLISLKTRDIAQGTESFARFGLDYATVSGTGAVRVLSGTEVDMAVDDNHRLHITAYGTTLTGDTIVSESVLRLEKTFTHEAGTEYGIDSQATHTASGTGTSDFTYAVGATTTALGAGHHINVAALLAAVHFNGTGTATQLLAVDAVASHHGSNTVTTMYGGNFGFELTDAGNATNAVAVQIAQPTYSSAGRIGTNMGLYIQNLGHAGQTASAGIVILDQSGSATLNNSIYAYGGKADFNVSNTAAADFNIHGQNDDNAFYMDVSADSLGLGTATPSSKLDIVKDDATTNAVVDVLELTHSTTGTAAAGIGTGLVFYSEDASGNIDEAGRINCKFPTATHASQTGQMDLSAFGTTLLSLFTGAAASANRITVAAHANYQSYVPYFTEYDNGSSGATKTFDWNNGIKQKVTMTASCSGTFTAPPGPCNLTLFVVQSGSGSYTMAWPATVKWPAGTAPTLSTAVGAVDIVSFYYNGTNYYGDSSLNFS